MFGGSGSIKLFRIFGIRIGVDASWFLVLFIFIFLLSGTFKEVLDASDGVAYATAVGSVLLFFVSLILHEMGHALAAKHSGIGIEGIDLWFFGGVAKMSRDTRSPREELKVSLAGPLVTLIIVGICVGLSLLLGDGRDFWSGATLDGSGASISPGLLLVSWLATINAFLFLFNMIPAYPLDGGRVARAIAWKITGSRLKATRIAAGMGQVFGYLLIGIGIAQALLTSDIFNGFWLMLLGWFLLQAARGAVAQTRFAESVGGVTVADIMDHDPVAIPSTVTLADAVDSYFLRYRWSWFPVIDPDGHYLGIVRQERAEECVEAGDGSLRVSDVLDVSDYDGRVADDAPLEDLLGDRALREIGALFAVDVEGVLRGVVTSDQVRRAIASAAASPGPAA
ncbi:MAG: site-2 protease family protein [Actinomycetota bacterium]